MPRKSAAERLQVPSPKPAAAYHHGDLRAALIQAAREALETAAPEAITLKSLALRLGVSQPAPYRHFENREALLAAVAADGFERFRAALVDAAVSGAVEEAFERSCLAYIAFGQANMGVYRLMFSSGAMRVAEDQNLARASEAAFKFLLDAVSERAPQARAEALAIWIWSSLHGMVMLMAEGLMSGPLDHQVTPADVVRQMVKALADR
jgi:AcrR family transcriptional regulator